MSPNTMICASGVADRLRMTSCKTNACASRCRHRHTSEGKANRWVPKALASEHKQPCPQSLTYELDRSPVLRRDCREVVFGHTLCACHTSNAHIKRRMFCDRASRAATCVACSVVHVRVLPQGNFHVGRPETGYATLLTLRMRLTTGSTRVKRPTF